MKQPLSLFFLFVVSIASAQQLKGRVVEKNFGKPLANASVYVNNSSLGTVTNSNGDFLLEKTPAGHFDLVVSFVGYTTFVEQIDPSKTGVLRIELSPREEYLTDVVVRSYEKDGWAHWGFLFTNSFIGTSAFADHCYIQNANKIRFQFEKRSEILNAFSTEPLIIINKSLGYRIQYDLVKFAFDFKKKSIAVIGYPLFQELKAGPAKREKWLKNRAYAYVGSLLQLMKALYYNKLTESGFQIKRLVRLPNSEKRRTAAMMALYDSSASAPLSSDTLAYYRKVSKESDFTDMLYPDLLTRSSIISQRDSSDVQLWFDDLLYITYPEKKEAPEYYQRNNNIRHDTCMTSIVYLCHGVPVTINKTGEYHAPLDLMITGYWAWWEKIATMLPLDYVI